MKKLLLPLLTLYFFTPANSQCIILPNATTGTVSLQCAGGTGNRSGVAYNPAFSLYYSVNAGSSGYPIETYSSTGGAPVNTIASGFDYRGLWWNPNTSQLVGNGYNTNGVVSHVLNGSGYATGVVNTIFTGFSQPSPQSCGTYDYNANELLYYGNDGIYRYNPTTGAFLSYYPVTGLPVAYTNIDSTNLGYTGCLGEEIVLYDFVNKAVYFINKANGAHVGTSQLPLTAMGGDRFMFGFANNMAWVYDQSTSVWQSYEVFQPTGNFEDHSTEMQISVYPNPSSGSFTFKGIENGTIEIYNTLGEKIYSLLVASPGSVVNLSDTPKGIYFWKAVNDTNAQASGTLLIQ